MEVEQTGLRHLFGGAPLRRFAAWVSAMLLETATPFGPRAVY